MYVCACVRVCVCVCVCVSIVMDVSLSLSVFLFCLCPCLCLCCIFFSSHLCIVFALVDGHLPLSSIMQIEKAYVYLILKRNKNSTHVSNTRKYFFSFFFFLIMKTYRLSKETSATRQQSPLLHWPIHRYISFIGWKLLFSSPRHHDTYRLRHITR